MSATTQAAARPTLGVAFYGKGGVGKSTVAAHVSVALHEAGLRVLLVGCDPKQDASVRFGVPTGAPTLVDAIAAGRMPGFDELRRRTTAGVDVIETGGAEPGTGCAGRGVASLVELLRREDVQARGYDALCFDVLGDLVCGGFVAPLRLGLVQHVFVVASEEVASLFVAANVARVVLQPYNQGVALGGVIFNLRRDDAPTDVLREFAEHFGMNVLGFVHRDALVLEAEARRTTVLDYRPTAPIAEVFRGLAREIRAATQAPVARRPTPGDQSAFWDWVRLHKELL